MSGLDSKKPKRRKLKKTTVTKAPEQTGTPVDDLSSSADSEVNILSSDTHAFETCKCGMHSLT